MWGKSLRTRAETIGWSKSDCAIIPENETPETRFDSFLPFAFELYLVYSPLESETGWRSDKALLDSQVRASGCLSIEQSRKTILPVGMFFEMLVYLTRLYPKVLS